MRDNHGQIAVFVLLVMLMGLTVGLSITSRTIQDIRQSQISDQSSRAFTAAEAGIEEALSLSQADLAGKVGTPQPVDATVLGFNGNITYEVSQSSGNTYTVNGVKKDDVVSIDLGGLGGDSITVFWNSSSEAPVSPYNCGVDNSGPSSLELTFYYLTTGGNYGVQKFAYNSSSCNSLGPINHFSQASAGSSNFNDKTDTLTIPSGSKILLRIRPIYRGTSIMVQATKDLPPQAYEITATATTSGGATRRVQVTKSAGTLPSIFDYVLFSGQDLKQ